ncbi:hypothetical protein J5N97_006791 [Dioscorea zingiberensis]|uniref:UV-B-induced protein At3g17800, chloroplastic-like n=1 Tax=Dioscorea zingiberensis TaxID=325984 RepID=A0A9D5DCQ9_9LILI|nr:hypothetical protein J5N97_006791 [Dioscorea zingiberensis]
MKALSALNQSPCCCHFGDFASRSSVGPKSHFSTTWSKGFGSISVDKKPRRTSVLVNSRRSLSVRASSSSSPIAPLQLESPIGQFLSEILISYPHLLPAAVDQQLEQLQTSREAEKSRDEPSSSGTDLVLYRRIAEVKANERRRALEEILYALVVQKFMEANVSLIPPLTQSADSSGRVDNWPSELEKFEHLHSLEVLDMIKTYMTQILGTGLEESNMLVAISKRQIGRVYAASIMFGYFLKRVDQRFQLEKSMKTLPWGSNKEEPAFNQDKPSELRPSSQAGKSHPEFSSWSSTGFSSNGSGFGNKPSRLWTYVMSFGPETTRRYATIRSKESFNIIEKQTEALFGKSDILVTPPGSVDSSQDELIKISFGGLKRLILEAVTFGSFLWDVESYADSRYHFVNN